MAIATIKASTAPPAKSNNQTRPLRVLLFSDFHDSIDLTHLGQAISLCLSPDIVFTLGDISVSDLISIKDLVGSTAPIYGLHGNHDGPTTLQLAGIPNLHGKADEVKGFRFAGFEGSVRYRRGPNMFSQKESLAVAKALPPADILISHDKAFCGKKPFRWPEYSKDPHEGMVGITSYLRKNSPLLHIHGHTHENKRYLQGSVDTFCVYGAAFVTLNASGTADSQPLLHT